MAPEVLLGNYSQEVDIWAAGVVLHVLLLGTLPFRGNSVEAIFEAIKTVELDFHSEQWEPVSLLARDLISKMLNRDASSRLAAADVLRHPWISFYDECPLKAEFSTLWSTNNAATPVIDQERVRSCCQSSSSESSSDNSEERDDSEMPPPAMLLAIVEAKKQCHLPPTTRLPWYNSAGCKGRGKTLELSTAAE